MKKKYREKWQKKKNIYIKKKIGNGKITERNHHKDIGR